VGELVGDPLDVWLLQCRAPGEQRIAGACRGEAGVDHPAEWFDPGAPQVGLQLGGFGDGGGFGEGDDEQSAEVGVLQPHQRCGQVSGALVEAAHDLPVVSAGDVEQQQGVPGRCGVDDDVLAAGHAEQVPECAEDGELGGAR